MAGGMSSTLTVYDACPTLPFRSAHDAERTMTPLPDDVVLASHCAGSSPESASLQFHAIVTGPVCHPLTPAAGVAVGCAVGAVVSGTVGSGVNTTTSPAPSVCVWPCTT